MEFTTWLPELWDDLLPIGRLCDRMEGFCPPKDCDTADERRGIDVVIGGEAIIGISVFDADIFLDGTLDERPPDAPLDERLADILVDVVIPELAANECDRVTFLENELSNAPLEFETWVGLPEL